MEECGSAAYTQGTNIFLGEDLLDLLYSSDEDDLDFGRCILWHELFHCITKNNPDFRRDMYNIIHFNVQDQEYKIPPVIADKVITNPDVEHHNSYATFDINGNKIDCFTVLITTKPFEKEGDIFFDNMEVALVPVDGSDILQRR